MWCIVGLGNPGEHFFYTRHNVGFQLLTGLIQHYHIPPLRLKSCAWVSQGVIGAMKVLVTRSKGYMNLSGFDIAPLVHFYKLPLENVLVLHDDLDLPFGSIRVKKGGGDGGHRGLKSLDAQMGKDYWRLRIGIGHPGHRDDVPGYVLGAFSVSEQERICKIFEVLIPTFQNFWEEKPMAWASRSQSLLASQKRLTYFDKVLSNDFRKD